MQDLNKRIVTPHSQLKISNRVHNREMKLETKATTLQEFTRRMQNGFALDQRGGGQFDD
jgi:hypothetical protein